MTGPALLLLALPSAAEPDWARAAPEPQGGVVYFVAHVSSYERPVACPLEGLRQAAAQAVRYVRADTRVTYQGARTERAAGVRETVSLTAAARIEGLRAVKWAREATTLETFVYGSEALFECWVLATYSEAEAVKERARLDHLGPPACAQGEFSLFEETLRLGEPRRIDRVVSAGPLEFVLPAPPARGPEEAGWEHYVRRAEYLRSLGLDSRR